MEDMQFYLYTSTDVTYGSCFRPSYTYYTTFNCAGTSKCADGTAYCSTLSDPREV